MRVLPLLVSLAAAGCATAGHALGQPRAAVVRDVEGYALASCLANQREPYLKDQGDGWAAVIVQRMKGDLDAITAVADQVKAELAKGEMAIIRDESGANADKTLPVLYCGEIIDTALVRAAIKKAVANLAPAYDE